MIKIIFFDFDGTIYSHKSKKIPSSTFKILNDLKERGVKVVLATGRHPIELAHFSMYGLDFDAYICLNGQLTFDSRKNVLFAHELLDRKALKKIFEEKEIPIQFMTLNDTFINFSNKDVFDSLNSVSTSVPPISSFQDVPFYQAILFGKDETILNATKDMKNSKITKWADFGFDLISNTGGKTSGIKDVLDYFGFDTSEVMVFGDGENDIDMLKAFKNSVAMGNALDEVKKVASYITNDIDEDGVYNAINYFDKIIYRK